MTEQVVTVRVYGINEHGHYVSEKAFQETGITRIVTMLDGHILYDTEKEK